MLCCIAGVAMLSVLLERTLRQDELAQFDGHGQTVAEALAKACEAPLIARDLTSVQSVLDATLKTPNVEWAYVTGPDGRVVAHTFVPEFPRWLLSLPQQERRAGIQDASLTGKKTVSTFDAPVLTGIVGSVHVGINQDDLMSAVHHAERVALGSILVVMLVLISALSVFTRHIVGPIRQLTRAAVILAENVRAEAPPLQVRARDEIGLLTTAFNKMASDVRQSHDRLEARVEERTAALARVNDELRGEIGERQRAEQALRDSQARYRSVVEQVSEVIFTIDARSCWTFLNPAWTQVTGFTVEESLGQPFLNFIFEDDWTHCLALYEAMMRCENDYCRTELRHITKEGGHRWLEVRAHSVTDAAGSVTGIFGTLSDITERKQAEEQLHHLALHDALTGLPNRLLFQDRLQGALSRAERSQCGVAVLFVDLDNFKVVNDSMGHEAGDDLLRAVAIHLQACTRGADTTARLGGDEFTLLLEGLHTVDEATEVAERITMCLKQPIQVGDREVFASASIGIVYSAIPDGTAEDLLRDADTAMYHAKASGKSGYVLFDPSMNTGVMERLEVETGLRFAIEREELRVYYQPLIDLQTGQMSGMEALARWEHPKLGLISPGKFIPIAEETGLIVPLGYWVLEEACRQVQEWKTVYPEFHDITISVNLSGKQLQRADIVDRVDVILRKTGIDPNYVKLEITESVMMKDVDDVLAKLHALKTLGVKLAMDDFGTGYSSMASLNLLPLDTVKIDRSFISRMADQEDTRSVILAIIMLSRALQLDITGEGIETEEQVTYLQGLGCHVGQGYYFSKPLPPEVLSERMSSGQKLFANINQEWTKEQIERMLLAS
jgi:diguanylate cyclase (GGDEF)-like protein/PAS domain S-box-containing protein